MRPFRCWGIGFQHEVTGTLSPDATGLYDTTGSLNDHGYGQRQTNPWFIWYNSAADIWVISENLGSPMPAYWIRPAADGIEGQYTPQASASGTATVTRTA